MANMNVKELKGLHNVSFYPNHYFTESLADDAKAYKIDGKLIKGLKKTLAESVGQLTAGDQAFTDELRDQLMSDWFQALGFYEKDGDSNWRFSFRVRNKAYELPVERSFNLKGEGQLWILKHQYPDPKRLADDEDATEDAGGDEHFYQQAVEVTHKEQKALLTWKDIIDQIFDSDYSAAEWLIINFGHRLILIERGRWQDDNCAYLEADCNELFQIDSQTSYQVMESHFRAASFPIDHADFFLDVVEKNSHKKAAEVTKALRDTVRESIEIIANEILTAHLEEGLDGLKGYDLNDRTQREKAAQQIFDQSLRFIYRMLFMFFTESQNQRKGALPVQSRAYQLGYAIEKLRELENVPLTEGDSHFIHDTLDKAFRVYFAGYNQDHLREYDEHTGREQVRTDALGFAFPELGVDLFDPHKTPVFLEMWLSDHAMQQVIRKLSLAKVGTGRNTKTYRVHYAGLGLNQLGAVYEGLLSLKPMILDEKAVLLKRKKKEAAPRIVPYRQKKDVDRKLLDEDEHGRLKVYEKDSFVLTPVGLERKFSASYYTPEVLTRFLAKEAVDNLLGEEPSLERMEGLKICEPAMGSGAFLNAVVDEIAPRLARRYRERDNAQPVAEDQPAGNKRHKEQHTYTSQAKEHLMRHCVYGVDLNPTAVELAKISLWLNCIHEDGNLPFLDFKLKHGNSLIGCWITKQEIKLGSQEVVHFALPHPVSVDAHLNGRFLGDKNQPFLDDDERAQVKDLQGKWQRAYKDKDLQERAVAVSQQVKELYEQHVAARQQYRHDLEKAEHTTEKKKIFTRFREQNTAYNQLRMMMDLWCALWFWPTTKLKELPTPEDYLEALEWLAETPLPYGSEERATLMKDADFSFLITACEVALENSFFHWDLEYAEIFADGGFDLILGNPPWAPVRWEEEDFFEELRPGMHQLKADSKTKYSWYQKELDADSHVRIDYKDAVIKADGIAHFLKHSGTYTFKDKSQTNTYRYFFQRFYQLAGQGGVYAIIAQDGIFSDDGCADIRKVAIKETMKIYRFINYLKLFEDIAHLVKYMILISNRKSDEHKFELIDNLYHPSTITLCRDEARNAPYRGLKNDECNLELRGHPKRIVNINESVLKGLAKFSENGDWQTAKLPIIHGQIELAILTTLADHSVKMRNLEWKFGSGFHEAAAPKAGFITRKPGTPKTLSHAVMTGPNVFVANPANKVPNPGCKNKGDFHDIDLTEQPDDFFPKTVYQATQKGLNSNEYRTPTPWGTLHKDEFRIIARQMVSTTGARTLSTAIIPPGPSHVNAMVSLSFDSTETLLGQAGLFNSLIFDFLMRSISGGMIGQAIYNMTPTLTDEQAQHPLTPALMIRALRLSAISNHYAPLWKDSFRQEFTTIDLASPFAPKLPYHKLKPTWQRHSCIRDKQAREQTLCEIDSMVAILFGFAKDTLIKLYRSQFGVLQKNLQDLPNQQADPEKYHFPRCAQMEDAYDQLVQHLADHGYPTPEVA